MDLEVRMRALEVDVSVLKNTAHTWGDIGHAVTDLRVVVEGMKSQMKITWALLFCVLTGLISVAIGLFAGRIP